LSVLIVHPERHVLEQLASRLRREGIHAARTCRLVAALVYSVQLTPDVVVVGGWDEARGKRCADLLAACQVPMQRVDPGGGDFAVFYRRGTPRNVQRIVAAVSEVQEACAVSGAWPKSVVTSAALAGSRGGGNV
jgi:hypothetical protein